MLDLFDKIEIGSSKFEYNSPLESDFSLDNQIKDEKERRIFLYSQRVKAGTDIFNGLKLPLSELIATRGLGNLPIITALNSLSRKDKRSYLKEIKHLKDCAKNFKKEKCHE